jgi:hypothetical protein
MAIGNLTNKSGEKSMDAAIRAEVKRLASNYACQGTKEGFAHALILISGFANYSLGMEHLRRDAARCLRREDSFNFSISDFGELLVNGQNICRWTISEDEASAACDDLVALLRGHGQ